MYADFVFKEEMVASAKANGISPPERERLGVYHVGMGPDWFVDPDHRVFRTLWDEYSMEYAVMFGAEDEARPADYGTCDSVEQFFEKHGAWLENSPDSYAVTFTYFNKEQDSQSGGMRFHKHGVYIGNKRQGFEYFYQEPDMTELFMFHVYKKLSPGEVDATTRAREEMRKRSAVWEAERAASQEAAK
jgi:hypothetical protein